jgi:hypothetical protein
VSATIRSLRDYGKPAGTDKCESTNKFPVTNDECRPDLVISRGNDVTVIDVTCPFENGDSDLATADYTKVMKPISNHSVKDATYMVSLSVLSVHGIQTMKQY